MSLAWKAYLIGIAICFLIPEFSKGQIWKRTEEEPEPVWRLKGSFNWDFYPYSGLNSEKFYNSVWQFNYTAGVQLLHTTKEKPVSWGGGLVYSVKDFNQRLRSVDTNTKPQIVEKAEHSIRYTELTPTFEYEFLNTENAQLLVDGGLVFGFRETATTFKKSVAGRKDTLFINDREFGRFLWGLHYGFGFRLSIAESLSLETGLGGRFYFNDIGKSQYVNFSNFNLRLKLVYELSNKMGEKTNED